MTIDEILELWDKDNDIDATDIGGEIQERPKLHAKYLNFFIKESLSLDLRQTEHDKLILLKREYYQKELDDGELERHGWEPYRKNKVLKADLPAILDADDDVIKSKLKIAYHKQKVYILKEILGEIDKRHWALKTFYEYEKFKSGS